ncbi:MAG: hypothetical protein IIT68_03600 [Treponema sp.]|nr:hypothetical protein [Treponema sp.]
MKNFMRNAAVCLAALMLLVCEASCGNLFNMQIPQSVSVKTSAEYNVPLGNASFDMSEILNKEDLLNQLRTSMGSDLDLYEYINASNDVLTFVVHKNLYNVPFDFSQYLGNLNFTDAIEGNSGMDGIAFNQSIELPAVSVNPDPISISFADAIDAIESASFSSPGSVDLTDVPETGTTVDLTGLAGFTAFSVQVSNPYADKVKCSNGSALHVTVTKTDSTPVGDDFQFSMSLVIKNTSTNATVASAASTDVTNGGSITIDLSGKELPSSFTITPSGSLSGGTLGTSHDYELSFAFENTHIAKIEGVHVDAGTPDTSDDIDVGTIAIPAMSIPLSLPEMVGDMTIASNGGAINIVSSAMSGWTGVDVSFDSFSLTGHGLNLDESDLTDGTGSGLINKKLDLSGQTLTQTGSNISVSGSVSIDIDGATLDFGSAGTANKELTINVSGGITKLASVVVNLSSIDGVPTQHHEPFSYDIALPSELTQYVSQITFGEQAGSTGPYYKHDTNGDLDTSTPAEGFGISARYVNSLPEGNTIPIYVKSTLFGMDDTIDLEGQGSSTPQNTSCISYPTVAISDGAHADFEIYLPDSVTLTNLEMGNTYAMGLSDVHLACDWDTVDVDLSSVGSIPLDVDLSSFDIQQLLSNPDIPSFVQDMIDNVQIKELPVYMYAQKPTTGALADLLGTLSVDAEINLSYTDRNGGTHNDDLIGSDPLVFKTPVAWPDGTEIRSTDPVAANLRAANASVHTDLADIINDQPSNMAVTGSVSIGGGTPVTITSATINSLSGSSDPTEISIDMAAVLPFALKLTKQISFEPMTLAFNDWSTSNADLLQRENASSLAEYADYADMIDYVSIVYTGVNNVIPGMKIKVRVTDAESGIDTELNVESGTHALRFTGEEIKNVMTNYPFHPDVVVTMGRDYVDGETASTGYTSSDEELQQQQELYVSRRSLQAGADSLGADVKLTVKMDGDSPITVWGGNANGN